MGEEKLPAANLDRCVDRFSDGDVWDINFILDEQSTFGSLLKALFGYNGNPTLSELLAYLVYFALVAFGISRIASEKALAQEV